MAAASAHFRKRCSWALAGVSEFRRGSVDGRPSTSVNRRVRDRSPCLAVSESSASVARIRLIRGLRLDIARSRADRTQTG